jgi:DNA helicase II / ATP-dependent DNA helicase PcrA
VSPGGPSLGEVSPPGPTQLGRSVVIGHGGSPPAPWANAERFVIDRGLLGDDSARLGKTVDELQRRYVGRVPTVYVLEVEPEELTRAETTDVPPYELGATFTFPLERLAKVVWHNSYDARVDPPVWWWAHKAATRLGVEVDGPADVIADDGTPMWIDGGPRQPLEFEAVVIHHESVELASSNRIPPRVDPRAELAEDQLDAVSHQAGPARVIAPAGSGKTRVLTGRVRHLIEDWGVEPGLITALAYNRRAAREMVDRLPGSEALNVRTLHSIGWEILRMAEPGLRLIDESEQRRRLEPIASAPPRANTDVIGPYLEALDEVRIALRHPEEVEAGRDDVPGFADTFRRYRDGLQRAGEADHGEQIYGAIAALCERPDLRAHWQTRCRHLLVDEFQDLTPAYLLLVRLLAAPGLNVFGVGDDDQVIYGYTGANPSYLIDFADLFPGAGEHALEINYRSPADVVDAATNLIGYNLRRVEKQISAYNETRGLEVASAPGDDLAIAAADRVAELIERGAVPSSIAVLARVNSSLLPVRIALAERGLPFDSLLTASILERTLLRATLAWIRVALDPGAMTRSDLFEIIRRPGRGIIRVFGELIGRRRGPFALDELARMGATLDGRRADRWDEFCDDIVLAAEAADSTPNLLDILSSHVGLDRAAAALDAGRTRADRSAQSDDLTALRRAAAQGPELAGFESWLRRSLAVAASPAGVMLSTVHRVKGLEWDHVIVFGADRGAMPHNLAEDVEEERRVFHVAITRGRSSVLVLADEKRPSRFLTEIDGSAPRPTQSAPPREDRWPASMPADGVHVSVGDRIGVSGGYRGVVTEILSTGVLLNLEETGATMPVPWGERVDKTAMSGRLAPGTGPADSDLADRLREWRLLQARAQGVPAYVVFNDRTLEALASLRPSTSEALLSVPGIGPAKLEAYGEELIELLALD